VDERLEPLRAICLALPEAELVVREPHAQFVVRKRTFAYFLDDHHGDGIVGITCKGPQERLAEHPERYYLPSYLGSRGWVALRLDVGEIDWDEVEDLVTGSYLQVAPKRLAAQVLG
jgi:phosphoribosylglycinamide formyltransferase-1